MLRAPLPGTPLSAATLSEMSEFWWGVAWRVGLLIVASLVLGSQMSPAWGWALLALGLGVLIALQLRYLAQLERWLAVPTQPGVPGLPEGWGAWETVFATLHKRRREEAREQHQLAATLREFQAASDALPDGLIILDRGDAIEWLNPAAARHFNLDLGKDRGYLITNLVRHPAFTEYLIRSDFREPLVLSPVTSPQQRLSLLLLPFQESRRILLSRDVTQLERVDSIRRDFIANVSHELRTPLTVVHGFLEQMIDDANMPNSDRARFHRLMLEQTSRMTALLGDLLTLSRLESGVPAERLPDVDVAALVRSVVEDARLLSNGRHVFTTEIDDQLRVPCQPDELRSAFSNLVSNAVRYTPEEGRIQVSWLAAPGTAGQAEIPVFSVKDSGIGIAPEHLPRLTERFYRVDRSRSRETGGTGLGLAIVKHILTRHGAQLEIDSQPEHGSTFSARFTLG